MRQLTYYIPIERMTRTAQIEFMVAQEAWSLNGSCLITYENLHIQGETSSLMIVRLFVSPAQCDYIHRSMQHTIGAALAQWSPDTNLVRVTDIPVTMRDFNAKEIL